MKENLDKKKFFKFEKFEKNKKNKKQNLSEESRVISCLMEYGESVSNIDLNSKENFSEIKENSKSNNNLSSFDKDLAKAMKEADKEEAERIQEAKATEDKLRHLMINTNENTNDLIGGNRVGNIVELQADLIINSKNVYDGFIFSLKI